MQDHTATSLQQKIHDKFQHDLIESDLFTIQETEKIHEIFTDNVKAVDKSEL